MSLLDAARFAVSGLTPVVFAILLVPALVLAGPLARRWSRPSRPVRRGDVLASLVTTALVLAVTTPVATTYGLSQLASSVEPARALTWFLEGWDAAPVRPGDTEGPLNVLLFLPAGAAWTVALARPWRALGGLVALSFLVETVQAVVGQRSADPRDLVANTLGAVLGVVVGLVWASVRARGWAGTRRSLAARARDPRQVAAALAAAGAVALLTWLTVESIRSRADARQELGLARIEAAYRDTTAADAEAALTDDTATGFEDFITRGGIRADYVLPLPEAGTYEARFQTWADIAPRCVLVTWAPGATDFRLAEGSECTESRG